MPKTLLQQADTGKPATFRSELRDLINKYSLENKSDTPDFLIAEYIEGCLMLFDETVKQRTAWHENTAAITKMNPNPPQDDDV